MMFVHGELKDMVHFVACMYESMWFIVIFLTKSAWNNSDGALNYPSLVTPLVIFSSFVHVKCGTSNKISSLEVFGSQRICRLSNIYIKPITSFLWIIQNKLSNLWLFWIDV